ncbi:unnamed protein product, partial [Polarella glacialis]
GWRTTANDREAAVKHSRAHTLTSPALFLRSDPAQREVACQTAPVFFGQKPPVAHPIA